MSAYTAFAGRFIPTGDGHFTASEPLAWDIGRKGSGLTVRVPPPYAHDVSVPRALRWLIDRHDPRYQRAARLHDWLLDRGWSAWTAAAIFYDALKADGTTRIERWAMSFAVLGWIALRRR